MSTAALCWALTAGAGVASSASRLKVIASGLNQPKKITVASGGRLIVAVSGTGAAPSSCTDGEQVSCAGRSGAIEEVDRGGKRRTLVSGLSSVSSGGADAQATGPAEAVLSGGRLQVLFQDSTISQVTGRQIFGAEGSLLGNLVSFARGTRRAEASFGAFEAKHDPDRGRGTDVLYGNDAKIGSDPYSFVAYRGGYAVADAGANDLLFVSPSGKVRVLAVLPTIRERAAAGTYSSSQKTAIEAEAQAVPDSVAVGPDGALYVGELGGTPYAVGASDVYRIVPGRRSTVYARGFTAIEDLAFDARGRLLVLEIDRKGLNDPGFNTGSPASGAIVRVDSNGRRSTLVSSGLVYPTGIAVTDTGTVDVTNFGVSSASTGRGGEIVGLNLGDRR